MAKKPLRPLSDTDERLFAAAMKGVAPLAPQPKAKRRAEAAPAEPPPAPRREIPLPPSPRSIAPPPPRPAPLVAGATADTDGRTMLRLKRGRIRPEGRLDLHGMTQEAAHRALLGFIARAGADGRRCVLIVTGTGRGREGAGVLREQLPKWLNAPGLRPHVLGFATAQPADGGAGALYLLLRRKRGPGA